MIDADVLNKKFSETVVKFIQLSNKCVHAVIELVNVISAFIKVWQFWKADVQSINP